MRNTISRLVAREMYSQLESSFRQSHDDGTFPVDYTYGQFLTDYKVNKLPNVHCWVSKIVKTELAYLVERALDEFVDNM